MKGSDGYMKRRLQLILLLLFMAITVSMVAVSFGWYSAASNTVTMQSTQISVSTSENDYYGAKTEATCIGNLEYDSKNGVYIKTNYEAYAGQTCEGQELYILLFEATDLICCKDLFAYVNMCITTTPGEVEHQYNEENSPFKVILLDYDGTNFKEADSGEEFKYFAISFGNGKERFKFSYSEYKGTSFRLNVYFKN